MTRPQRYHFDVAQIRRMIETEGMSQSDVARVYGCHPSMISDRCRTHSIRRPVIALTADQVESAIRRWHHRKLAGALPTDNGINQT